MTTQHEFTIECDGEFVTLIVYDDLSIEFVDYDIDDDIAAEMMGDGSTDCLEMLRAWEEDPLKTLLLYGDVSAKVWKRLLIDTINHVIGIFKDVVEKNPDIDEELKEDLIGLYYIADEVGTWTFFNPPVRYDYDDEHGDGGEAYYTSLEEALAYTLNSRNLRSWFNKPLRIGIGRLCNQLSESVWVLASANARLEDRSVRAEMWDTVVKMLDAYSKALAGLEVRRRDYPENVGWVEQVLETEEENSKEQYDWAMKRIFARIKQPQRED